MKVAIIDSGIESNIFVDKTILQYRVYDGMVEQEKAVDYIDHGTSIADIILREIEDVEVISICPGIDENGNVDDLISPYDMALAIRTSVDLNADIINISMGTNDFCNRNIIDESCKYAYDNGCIIVCGTASDGTPSMPWASENVLKVWHIEGETREPEIENVNGVWHLAVHKKMFRTRNSNNNQFLGKYNSMATAWVTNQILKVAKELRSECEDRKKLREKIHNYIENNWFNNESVDVIYKQKVEIVIDKINEMHLELGNVCLLPYNKEMHSLVRFEEKMDYNIVAAVDSVRKGLVGKDIKEVLGLEKRGVTIVKKIEEVKQDIDTLVIGYLNEVEKMDPNFSLDVVLEENLKYIKANIFSFVPVDECWVKKYEECGLIIKCAPNIGMREYIEINRCVPYNASVSKPVIGVFGTSSSQGKFTLQLYIKECMKKRGIKCTHLTTEHQGELLGAEGVIPFGYERNANIHLPLEFQKQYIEKYMIYINYMYDSDFILVGGQSGVIPYSIYYEGFLHNAVLLEGIKPDFAILVYNPYMDDEEYVEDCMLALKSIYKCKTIAMAFSDYTKKKNGERWKKSFLSECEKRDLSENGHKTYGICCGCITDEKYIDKICDVIEQSCS